MLGLHFNGTSKEQKQRLHQVTRPIQWVGPGTRVTQTQRTRITRTHRSASSSSNSSGEWAISRRQPIKLPTPDKATRTCTFSRLVSGSSGQFPSRMTPGRILSLVFVLRGDAAHLCGASHLLSGASSLLTTR